MKKIKSSKTRNMSKGKLGKMTSAIRWENTTNKFRDAMIDNHHDIKAFLRIAEGSFIFKNVFL